MHHKTTAFAVIGHFLFSLLCISFIFGIGLGFPDSGKEEEKAEYVVNIIKLREFLGMGNSEDEVDDDIV